MVPLEQVRRLERPDRRLFTVYLARSVGRALGILIALAIIGLRFVDFDQVRAFAEKLATEGVPIAASIAGLFLVCYAIAALAYYIRYVTLRYRFEADGFTRISGLFFRHESFLAYARIQDVQVTQGVVERAFGIGTVAIQTASGTKGFEESIEGMLEFELVRDFLYERMKGKAVEPAPTEELALVTEIRDEMRALRGAIERGA